MGPGGIFGNIKDASMYLTMSNITASRNLDLLSIEGHEFFTLLKAMNFYLFTDLPINFVLGRRS